MPKNMCRSLLILVLVNFGFIEMARASLEEVPTFGDVAHVLIGGTDLLTRFVLAGALILGVGFIIFAISTYRQHRMTPKLVPLDRPILYLVLGLSLCCLPYLGDIFGGTLSTQDLRKKGHPAVAASKTKKSEYIWDIDAPLTLEKTDVANNNR